MTRIIFMGSPDFALPTLRALASHYDVIGVVTQPDRAAGRGRSLKPPPVKLLAQELGIEVLQPERLRAPEAVEALRRLAPDLIVVAAYGQILRPEVLTLPPFGCINVHASLLPRWRGASPIQHAILAGDAQTGVTIMKMDEGLDTGPILAQRATPIAADETAGALMERLAHLGADLLLDTLPDYLSGNIQPQPQPSDGVTYAPLLKKEDGLLDLTRPAAELARQVRAFSPWPGAFIEWQGGPLRILSARPSPEKSPGVGIRLKVQGRAALGTGEGILILEEVQPAGRNRMSSQAFLAGARQWDNNK